MGYNAIGSIFYKYSKFFKDNFLSAVITRSTGISTTIPIYSICILHIFIITKQLTYRNDGQPYSESLGRKCTLSNNSLTFIPQWRLPVWNGGGRWSNDCEWAVLYVYCWKLIIVLRLDLDWLSVYTVVGAGMGRVDIFGWVSYVAFL